MCHRLTTGLLVALQVTLLLTHGQATANSPAAIDRVIGVLPDREVHSGLSTSPSLIFIENVGQFPSDARFQAGAANGTAWLAENTVCIDLPEPPARAATGGNGITRDTLAETERELLPRSSPDTPVCISFLGANPHPSLQPFGRVDTRISYYVGADPLAWRTGVPAWSGVRYVDLYPGVDLEVIGEGGQWAWRLIGAPSAGSPDVRLTVQGAAILKTEGGMLHLARGSSEVVLPLPAAQAPYRVEGVDADDIAVDLHIPTSPVMQIRAAEDLQQPSADANPNLLYLLGVPDVWHSAVGEGIAVDRNGNAYIIGSDYGSILVARIKPDGSGTDYITYLGGSRRAWPGGVAVSANGYAYITGSTNSLDFPTTPGAYDRTHDPTICYAYDNTPCKDVIAAKLDPSGALVYSTFLGGRSNEDLFQDFPSNANGIAIDEAGNATIAGYTWSPDFPVTPGALDATFNTASEQPDGFVARLNPSGSSLVYSTFLGGENSDYVQGIALDPTDAATVTGLTYSADFPVTPGAFDRTFNTTRCPWTPCSDAFIARLTSDGSGLIYSTFLGGNSGDAAKSVAVDAAGAATVTGKSTSADFPTTPGAFDREFNPTMCGSDLCGDAFVTRLLPDGSSLDYSTFLGGTSGDKGGDIALDAQGAAYVIGNTSSSDFPTTPGAFDTVRNGDLEDAFITKIRADGTLAYSTLLEEPIGSTYRYGYGIALGGSDDVFITGETNWVPAFVAHLRTVTGYAECLPAAGAAAEGPVYLYPHFDGSLRPEQITGDPPSHTTIVLYPGQTVAWSCRLHGDIAAGDRSFRLALGTSGNLCAAVELVALTPAGPVSLLSQNVCRALGEDQTVFVQGTGTTVTKAPFSTLMLRATHVSGSRGWLGIYGIGLTTLPEITGLPLYQSYLPSVSRLR